MNEDDIEICGYLCRTNSGLFFLKCSQSNCDLSLQCKQLQQFQELLDHIALDHVNEDPEISTPNDEDLAFEENGTKCKEAPGFITIEIDNSNVEQRNEHRSDELNEDILSENESSENEMLIEGDPNKILNDVKSLSRTANLIYGKIYKCDLCYEMVEDKQLLQKHMRLHCSTKLWQCNKCECKSYYSGMEFRQHLTKHLKSDKFYSHFLRKTDPKKSKRTEALICEICNKRFSTQANYNVHCMRHCEMKYYKCSLCEKAFYVNCDFKTHLRKSHLTRKCEKSPVDTFESFTTQEEFLVDEDSLPSNYAVEVNDDELKASETSKPTLTKETEPKKTQSKEVEDTTKQSPELFENSKTFCEMCNHEFYDKGALAVHMRRHLGLKKYKCEMCLKAFYTNGERTRHMLSHFERQKKPKERKYKCELCGLLLTDPSNLKAHIRRHFDENRKHSCLYCDKHFFTQSEVNAHIRSHTGDHPFLCSDCGQSYAQRGDFLKHQRRMHGDGERKFKCELCSKAFHESSKLKEHLRTHSDERNFQCMYCGTAFKSRKTLTQHTKIHENRRQYKCCMCDASFNQAPGLRSHMKTKHLTQ